MIRYALLVLVLIGAWFVGSPGALAQTSKTGRADFMSREKKVMLWDWYRSSGFECIHRHEGAWRDAGAPYWGGFQMGWTFMDAYGRHYGKHIRYLRRYGTANHWPVVLQIHAAKHGAQGQGIRTAWPNTSVTCGLR